MNENPCTVENLDAEMVRAAVYGEPAKMCPHWETCRCEGLECYAAFDRILARLAEAEARPVITDEGVREAWTVVVHACDYATAMRVETGVAEALATLTAALPDRERLTARIADIDKGEALLIERVLHDPAFVRVPRSVLEARVAKPRRESAYRRGIRHVCCHFLREYSTTGAQTGE